MEVSGLANIKSAKKRILVIETKTLRNKMIKSKIKTLVKKVEAAIEANDKAAAELHFRLLHPRSARLLQRESTTRTTLQERFPV